MYFTKAAFVVLVLVSSGSVTASEFPLYCSKAESATQREQLVADRAIPPPDFNETGEDLELFQIHVASSHGTRLPPSMDKPCWGDYQPAREDCSVLNSVNTAVLSASSGDEYNTTAFETVKKYDYEPWASTTGKACMEEQLMEEGTIQNSVNGEVLAGAYGPFLTSKLEDQDEPGKHVYFRSTDYQRTIASGQYLLSSLFDSLPDIGGVQVDLHTLELDQEYMDVIARPKCPLVNDLINGYATRLVDMAKTDSDFAEADRILQTAGFNYGVADVWHAQDCLIQALCANDTAELPSSLVDEPENLTFVLNQLARAWLTAYTEVDGFRGKLVLYKFFVDLQVFVYKVFSALAEESVVSDYFNDTSKFESEYFEFIPDEQFLVLWSGHDASLASMLTAMESSILSTIADNWNDRLIPLASMMILEFYTNSDRSKMYVRLLLNGKPLTQAIPACEGKELCAGENFLSAISSLDFTEYPFEYCGPNEDVTTTTKKPGGATRYFPLTITALISLLYLLS